MRCNGGRRRRCDVDEHVPFVHTKCGELEETMHGFAMTVDVDHVKMNILLIPQHASAHCV